MRGVALIAPHFIVEDISVALDRRDQDGLRDHGSRRQNSRAGTRDVDNAFYGWNDAWLDPKFRDWDISEYLAYIRVPVAIVQGADDQYGTMRQIEIAQEECYCPVDVTIIPGAGHSPHREAPEATLEAIAEFANAVLSRRRRRRAAWPSRRQSSSMKQNAYFVQSWPRRAQKHALLCISGNHAITETVRRVAHGR